MFKGRIIGYRLSVIGLVLIAGITGCAAWDKSAVKKTPLEIANTWNFGRIKEGTQVKHTFVFANETKKPLNITSVNTSCGCTVSEVDKRLLVPREAARITVTFDSKGYSGAIRQYVYIGTDNPEEPLIKFVITAEVLT